MIFKLANRRDYNMFQVSKLYEGDWTTASFDACAQVRAAEDMINDKVTSVEKAISANGGYAAIRLNFGNADDMVSFIEETRQDQNFILVRANSTSVEITGDLQEFLNSL